MSELLDQEAPRDDELVDMASISLEDLQRLIEDSNDIGSELVHCDEWGHGLVLEARAMTMEEKAAYMKEVAKTSNGKNVDFKAISLGLLKASVFKPAYNEDGKWIPGQSAMLAFSGMPSIILLRKSAAVLERLTNAVSRLSGIGGGADEDEADAEAEGE